MLYFYRLILVSLLMALISCEQQTSKQDLFDSVWQTVYDTYPDTTYESVDWVATGESYRQQLPTTNNDDDFISLLNRMLFELNVSHTFIGRSSEIEQEGSPYMFKPGSPGIDIRILDDLVVVTRVGSDSNAANENLLPGSIITKIDNRDVSAIISAAPSYPPYNDRYKRFLQTEELLRFLYGEVGSSVRIDYLDRDGNPEIANIVRMVRNNKIQLAPDFPPVYIECDWKMLQHNVGYLRFNAFQPENPIAVLAAIDSLRTAESLVIDLRGNNGGSLEAQRLIAGRFLKNAVIGAFMESRNGIDTLFYNGNETAFTAPIAILIDEVSISGAELFPASMQALGRAVVVGTNTPGAVMGGSAEFLSDGLVLIHPTLIIRTSHGTNLEGVGVSPDIFVPLDRELLTRGVDSQLEAAIAFLTKRNED